MIIVSRFLLNVLTLWNPKVRAMALWPFIVFRDKESSLDRIILNHEKIHHRQQTELLLIPYYTMYFIEYWWAMFRNGFKHHTSYLGVSFETEAFAFEKDADYLKTRPFMASWDFFKKKIKNP